jgi:hypothetical protein
VARGWRKLHIKDFHNLYSPQNIVLDDQIKEDDSGGPEGNRLPGTPRRKWEDNIKMDLKEIRVEGCALDSSGSR